MNVNSASSIHEGATLHSSITQTTVSNKPIIMAEVTVKDILEAIRFAMTLARPPRCTAHTVVTSMETIYR